MLAAVNLLITILRFSEIEANSCTSEEFDQPLLASNSLVTNTGGLVCSVKSGIPSEKKLSPAIFPRDEVEPELQFIYNVFPLIEAVAISLH